MATSKILTGTQQFVLNQFFSSFPQGMDFEEVLTTYEAHTDPNIVASEFWSQSLLPEDLVKEARSVESDLRPQFFPPINGDYDLMQNLWSKVHEHVFKAQDRAKRDTFDWLSICDNGTTLTSFNRRKVNISKDDFLKWFREGQYNEEMSADECIEVFLTALKGSSDFSTELFERLFSEYEVPHLKVVDESTLSFNVISGFDDFNGKSYPYREVIDDKVFYKVGINELQDAMQSFCSGCSGKFCKTEQTTCESEVLDNTYVYYASPLEFLTWSDEQLADYIFRS